MALLLLLNNFDYILQQNDNLLAQINWLNKSNNNFKEFANELKSLKNDLDYINKISDSIVVGMFRVEVGEMKRGLVEMMEKQESQLQKGLVS